ncbi:hypothetical protein [Arthrobacter zhaoxinii]|uniref:hypothetical protein n=1 Tax=Arthrobacter zhaoxinii TaxID=2964616 RepID=UPI0027E2A6C3|nr:hypothetical protein [Arthrobacter zhaoxinii]
MTEEPVVPEAAAENSAAASGTTPAAGEHEAPGSTPEGAAPDNDSPDTGPRSPRRRGNRRAVSAGPVGAAGLLPVTAKEDDPRVWGDSLEDSDSWLREQRPPHWG